MKSSNWSAHAMSRWAMVLVTMFGAACNSDASGPNVTTVNVSAATQELIIGQTTQLTATALDGKGNVVSGQNVEWSSNNTAVASVSATGLVTALNTGTSQVTATIRGQTGSALITVVPPPVASIEITPNTPTVEAGMTVQLTATTRDVSGSVLPDRTIDWSSENDAIATVNPSGLVLGIGAGVVDITAESEGVSTSVSLTVTSPPGSLAIASIVPELLIEGGSATITGMGFSPSAAGNVVTIDGEFATVVSASSESITITVPSSGCMPARNNAVVRVSVGGQNAERTHAVRPATFTDLPVGSLTLLAAGQNSCLQFDETAASTSFIIGVQSVSETPGNRTPVRIQGRAAAVAGTTIAFAAPGGEQHIPISHAHNLVRNRRERHRSAELALREQQADWASHIFAEGRNLRPTSLAAGLMSNAIVPVDAEVGDTIQIRMPDRNDLCNGFTMLTTVVRYRGTRGIWIEDIDNPAGGFSESDYSSLGSMLDNQIWAVDSTYFGSPTDIDANGRIVVVVTKEINESNGLLGFVSSADFFPNDCIASNGGEYYYGIAPDPTGSVGPVYSVDDALEDAPSLIAHEFTHIIQFGRRLFTPGATSFASIWELEGQATFAEEVNGHAFTGNAVGQNYGFSTAWSVSGSPPIAWYQTPFVDLALYFGYQTPTSKVGNAPEQCGWLGRPSPDDPLGPCLGNRNPYGVSWSFLRWLSDQYGPEFSGGEAELHRNLVTDVGSGFATISRVIGRPVDELLAHWAASLYVDDRYNGLDPRLRFTSWNLLSISSGLVESAHLAPRIRGFANFSDDVTVIAGSTAYYVVSGTSRPSASLSFLSQSGSPLPPNMRIWIVRSQ